MLEFLTETVLPLPEVVPPPLEFLFPLEEIILVFASNTEVLNVEDTLEELGLSFELIPVPKEVNPNCGLAISFAAENEMENLDAIKAAHFNPIASYMHRGDEFKRWPPPLPPLPPLKSEGPKEGMLTS